MKTASIIGKAIFIAAILSNSSAAMAQSGSSIDNNLLSYSGSAHAKTMGEKPQSSVHKTNIKATAVFEKENNIYVVFSDNSKKQLTFSKTDTQPVLLNSEHSVIFVRNTFGDVKNPKVKKIMKVDYNTLIEHPVIDRKPNLHVTKGNQYIFEVKKLYLSVDEKNIYFLTDAYVESDNLVKYNLKSGSWQVITEAVDFELIKSGSFKNMFLVGKALVKDTGREVNYYLINENNETLKELNKAENCNDFKNSLMKN